MLLDGSKRPLRIMQLASTSEMGGAERMICFLVQTLPPDVVQSYVGCLLGSGELLERSAPYCSEVIHLRFTSFLSLRGSHNLYRFLKSNRIDILHTYGLRADTIGRLVGKLAGVPVVVSGIRSTDPWRKWYHTFLDRLTSPCVDLFISNSQAGKDAAIQREKFNTERIRVIYSGLPAQSDTSQPLPETVSNLPSSAYPVITVLANIREMKGHADILNAMPAILKKFPNTMLIFAGRDDSNGAIKKQALTLGVAEHILFPGYVRNTTALLEQSHIFCLPSHWEGLPVSIIEAMRAGLPIITTPVGGIPEMVTDRIECIMIPPGAPQRLADAVIELSSDTDFAQKLGSIARNRAHRMFSSETMVQNHISTYIELLDNKHEQKQ